MKTLTGTPAIPFTQLFQSTVNVHGVKWAWHFYSARGMTRFEFRVLMRSIRLH